ncbi:uncharacterized protein B0T15DRAFT_180590 [Chaetomium strumarium]|uniref:Uncharacterized protein n=1 Tax=Chaetomium strumarium TaxID=1170767 RepID=A0AAJ0M3D3_9PEZI|nr:hypothetical protein B0T15DRAFT_180590 [Chaetomium strumarium]
MTMADDDGTNDDSTRPRGVGYNYPQEFSTIRPRGAAVGAPTTTSQDSTAASERPVSSSPSLPWLERIYVRNSWKEFVVDFLADNLLSPTPSKAKMALRASEVLQWEFYALMPEDQMRHAQPQYLMYHPDKGSWSVEDHYVRFIVTAVRDNMLNRLWIDDDMQTRGLEIARAGFDILVYLRTTKLGPLKHQSQEGHDDDW